MKTGLSREQTHAARRYERLTLLAASWASRFQSILAAAARKSGPSSVPVARAVFLTLAFGALSSSPLRGQIGVDIAGQSATQSSPAVGEPLRFEVASIKRNTSGSLERLGGFQPGGRFRAGNMTLRQVIASAYGDRFPVPDQQILGGPAWMDSDRFDIDARAAGDPSRPQLQAMLRNLLVERFALVSRDETREMPVYALRLSRSDGSPGPDLRPSSGDDCVTPGAPGPAGAIICGSTGFVRGRGFARAATMEAVARFLLPAVGRIVVNETGLAGTFTFEFAFSPDPLATPQGGTSTAGATVADTPSIFTALRERLGLRLDTTRAPVSVLVVQQVERPAEN